MAAKDSKPPKPETSPVDGRAHRRLLRFLNEAGTPGQLEVAPHDRAVVDEDLAHTDHLEHHPKERRTFKRDLAASVLALRDHRYPAHGFSHVNDLLVDTAIARHLQGILDDLLFSFGPANYGRWDLLYDLEVGGTEISIEHAALLRSYEVVFLADGTDTLIWDPADEISPQYSLLSGATTGLTANLLCCGHSCLSDGQLLAVGGGGFGPFNPTSNQAWRFDPVSHTWERTAGNMTIFRWYPTALTLGDELGPTGASGRVVVAGCHSGSEPVIEIYSEASDTFSTLDQGATVKDFDQTYPGLHLLPGGEIFYVPTGFGNCSTGSVYPLSDKASYFTFSGPLAGSWTDIGSPMNRTKGMSALLLQTVYPFVRVIVVGGGATGTSPTAEVANLSTLSPSWGAPISIPDGRTRVNVSSVLLPDGTVFVCGGTQSPPHTSWIYDPSAPVSAWSEMDELNAPRHYHSCVLLLPSGKVMAAGGASSGGCSASVENTIEVFSPPYLFNADGTPAARPGIATVDGVVPTTTLAPTVHHGATFVVGTPQAPDIAKVVLVRPMAVTHQTDTEQRVVHCPFTQTGPTTISAVAPDGIHPHAIAPRGYYMLFLLDGAGVPSEGKFVHLH